MPGGVALPPGTDPKAVTAALRAAFPDSGWRIRDATEAAPGVDRAVEQTSLFLTLVGLCALLVGGIGVATGVRAWLEARALTIATLRCLGASARLIFAVFLIQVMALCAAGVVIGLVAGAALPIVGLDLFGDLLPVPVALGVYPDALGLAAVYGLLTAAAFALWPLARAAQIPGAALFRDALLPSGRGVPAVVWAVNGRWRRVLVGMVVLTSADRGFALWFCGSAAGTLVLFRGGGWALMAVARRVPVRHPAWLRLGVANLYRPAAATPLLLVALGLGLTTLAAVALIQGNIRQQVLGQLPVDAPSFFFIDIQNEQLAHFEQIVDAQPGVSDLHQVPALRARIVALKGVPVDQVHVAPGSQWALRGDRGLTYSAGIPRDSTVVAGQWWPPDYAGPPLVSMDADLARGWGLTIGDTLRANVLGRDIDFRVASRQPARDPVARPGHQLHAGRLAGSAGTRAPHMHIATVRDAPGGDAALLRASDGRTAQRDRHSRGGHPADGGGPGRPIGGGTGGHRVGDAGVRGAGAGGRGRGRAAAGRMAEAVVLKTLGATRAQIRGGLDGGVRARSAPARGCWRRGLGTLASWGVVHYLMRAPWSFLPGILAATVLGCIVLMLGFGYAGTESALRARAAPFLRNE